ncbi:MAG: hypothetical protein ACKO2V_09145 [Snowella sp.]
MKKSQKRFKINTQYLLIRKYLQQFDNNELTLDRLISELEDILETFPNSNEKWKKKFRSEWWTLEQVYAVACDRGETTLNSESENLIYETLENMKNLLKEVTQGPIDEAIAITLDHHLSKTAIK